MRNEAQGRSAPQAAKSDAKICLDPSILGTVRIQVYSSATAPRQALHLLKVALAPLNLTLEELGTIELIMAEALNNIWEHAYQAGRSNGPIELFCRQTRHGLLFDLIDTGQPLPGEHIPLGTPADLSVATRDIPEGGYGWFLIRDLAKDITYRRLDAQNHLHLRMAIAHAR